MGIFEIVPSDYKTRDQRYSYPVITLSNLHQQSDNRGSSQVTDLVLVNLVVAAKQNLALAINAVIVTKLAEVPSLL